MKDLILIALLLLIMTGSLYDLVTDSSRGASVMHLTAEGLIFIVATVLIIWLLNDLRRQRRALEQLRLEVTGRQAAITPATPELAETRQRLGNLIQQQFKA